MQITKEIREELERIRRKDDCGMLRPEAIVEESRRKKSPLHSLLLWDDPNAAAHRGRLDIARELIVRVKVTMITPEEKHVRVRAYVSMPSDRTSGAGYRHIDDVMTNTALKTELITAAVRDLELFEKRYRDLRDLATVWDSIGAARKTLQEAAG